MKLSVVAVKCIDQMDTRYVVEMQLFNVQGFEERVIYNASKAFTMQLRTAEDYRNLKGVVGVTLCDFSLWPDPPAADAPAVPMLSRWRMQEQHTGIPGLPQVQYVFLELAKYAAGPHPSELVDKWALFFREAENLEVIPPELDEEPFREAFEIARTAQLSEAEYEAYEQAKMAEQDARGALGLAGEQGEARGRAEGRTEGRVEGQEQALRRNIRELCDAFGIGWSDKRQSTVDARALEELQGLWRSLLRDQRWP